jgi:hypothetical protein
MPRSSSSVSFEQVVREAVRGVVARVAKVVADKVSTEVQQQLEAELGRLSTAPKSGRARRSHGASRPARKDLTKWVADHRARRVPTFVIDATGLDTKKKIVAKFGVDAVFEKGKALPGAKASGGAMAEVKVLPRVVKAKPPLVRKAGAT